MTDLERARIVAQSALRNFPDGTVTWDRVEECIEAVMHALAAARREGAEEMRERAAELAEVHWGAGASFIAEDIRALPLTPEEPA